MLLEPPDPRPWCRAGMPPLEAGRRGVTGVEGGPRPAVVAVFERPRTLMPAAELLARVPQVGWGADLEVVGELKPTEAKGTPGINPGKAGRLVIEVVGDDTRRLCLW